MKRLFSLLFVLVSGILSSNAQILKGDMNNDGNLDVADVTSLVNTILGKTDKEFHFCIEDFIRDNKLTGYYEVGDKLKYYKDGVESENEAYVDLGLSSGLLWASSNLGAESPYLTGDFYAWGEVMSKTSFLTSNYKYYDNASANYTKYNSVDGLSTLELSDDAANSICGDGSHIPNYAEWYELASECYLEWTSDYSGTGTPGTVVYKVKSASDKGKYSGSHNESYSLADTHIFLPAAGWRGTGGVEDGGYYWTSTNIGGTESRSFGVVFAPTKLSFGTATRPRGLLIRPVIGRINKTRASAAFGQSTVNLGTGDTFTQLLNTNSTGSVRYSSSASTIASVDPITGTVTAKSPGSAIIRAIVSSTNEFYPSCAAYTVTVSEKAVEPKLLVKSVLLYDTNGNAYSCPEGNGTIPAGVSIASIVVSVVVIGGTLDLTTSTLNILSYALTPTSVVNDPDGHQTLTFNTLGSNGASVIPGTAGSTCNATLKTSTDQSTASYPVVKITVAEAPKAKAYYTVLTNPDAMSNFLTDQNSIWASSLSEVELSGDQELIMVDCAEDQFQENVYFIALIPESEYNCYAYYDFLGSHIYSDWTLEMDSSEEDYAERMNRYGTSTVEKDGVVYNVYSLYMITKRTNIGACLYNGTPDKVSTLQDTEF